MPRIMPTNNNEAQTAADHETRRILAGTTDFGLGLAPDQRDTELAGMPSERAPGAVVVPGYEIEAVLGRGSMGVVYKAKHLALKRTVALKMMLAGGHASPGLLARFRIEAEAVARLQHPNIVQIHEVGQVGGHPYCALEFVDGGNLADKITDKPMPVRGAAQLVQTLARAMQLAHSRNVVHRDLKPANVLLAADGMAKITDFGLARQLDVDSRQTQAGTVVGSPCYMAPEQALGQGHEAGPAADVYALGAILYDCLTGRPPFLGKSVVDTLDQVRTQEPMAPSRWQAYVPLDLETICLKCLQKEPEKRYPSAAELADDLGRFLNGEPVRARPVGKAERVWRWCRRNPWVAGLSATAALLMMCIAVGAVVVALRMSAQNQVIESEKEAALKAQGVAQKNEEDAIAARKLADQNVQETATQAGIALGAMQTMIKQVQEQLDEAPGTQQLKEELLKMALSEVDKVNKAAEKSTSIEATRMAGLMQLGQLYRQLGKSDDAMAQFRKVHDIARARVTLKKGTDAARLNLAITVRTLADMDREVNRDMQAALAHEKEALALFDDIDQHPKTDEKGDGGIDKGVVKDHLAEMQRRTGIVYLRFGDITQAAAYFQKALQLQRERYEAVKYDPKAKPTDVLQRRLTVAAGLLAVGDAAYRLDDAAKATESFAEALQSYEEMLAQNPKSMVLKRGLAGARTLVGDYRLRAGDNAKAGELYSGAYALVTELAQADPKKFDYKWDLASAHYRLGQLALRTRDATAAKAHFQECLALRQQLADKDKSNERRKMELMLVLAHYGNHAKAAEIAADLEKSIKPDAESLIDLTRTYAQCAAATDSDPQRASHYVAEALRVVRSAIALGYRDHAYLKSEVDLDPLRATADFTSILDGMGHGDDANRK